MDMESIELGISVSNNEDEVPIHESRCTSAGLNEDKAQYDEQQQGKEKEEYIQDSIEDGLEPELETNHQSDTEGVMADPRDKVQEQDDTQMDEAHVEHQVSAGHRKQEAYGKNAEPSIYAIRDEPYENTDHSRYRISDQSQGYPRTNGTNMQPPSSFNFQSTRADNQDSDNDASTLFVPERASSSPHVANRVSNFIDVPPPSLPTAPPRTSNPPTSMFDKIKGLHKKFQEKKAAATKRKSLQQYGNPNPDSEAYLEAVISGQSRSMGAKGPKVHEGEMVHRQASAEFQKQKRYYDDLRRRSNGTLSFRHDVEWMKIRAAEDARQKKRKRDHAYAQEEGEGEGEGEPGLFPEVNPPTADEQEEEPDDPFNDDWFDPGSHKRRRRDMPRKEAKQMSMQDAELSSMRVALEAHNDKPKNKKAQSDHDASEDAPQSSRKGRGAKSKSTRVSKTQTPKKVAAKGSRKSAKDKRLTENALKQVSSLFTSNVFQQQASADAMEQPTFTTTRRKHDALKELIASVPLGDRKIARSDMNVLLAATKDFNGRGSVKPHGSNGGWMVKGMKTTLRPHQVLGTSFMRRRENDEQEPKGGLMADQMGLGKTLMMLGKYDLVYLCYFWYWYWNVLILLSKHCQWTTAQEGTRTQDYSSRRQ